MLLLKILFQYVKDSAVDAVCLNNLQESQQVVKVIAQSHRAIRSAIVPTVCMIITFSITGLQCE